MRLVKGSHIVVPRLFEHRFAYIFQNEDRRIVFAIPYEHDFTLIGTTDVDYHGDPAAVHIDADGDRLPVHARQPLLPAADHPARRRVELFRRAAAARRTSRAIPMSVTRDYALELDREPAPLLSVFGGKITTYRRLAEDAVKLLAGTLGARAPRLDRERHAAGRGSAARAASRCSCARSSGATRGCPRALRRRYAHAYGTRIERVLGDAPRVAELGTEVLPQLYERELEYLCREEFARTAQDILWRRSKLGLHLLNVDTAPLERWLQRHTAALAQRAALAGVV